MATAILRPNGFNVTNGSFQGGGLAALNDQSDSTSINDAFGTGPSRVVLDFGSFTLPAGAQVRSVTPVAILGTGAISQGIYLDIIVKGTGGGASFFPNNTTKQTFRGGSVTKTPFNTTFDQSDLDSLQVAFYMPGTEGGSFVYEVWFEVVYNEKPVIDITAPTGTITATNRVTADFSTYTDPEGDAKERYQLKVFNLAQYGAVGFNPESSAAVWDSGVVFKSLRYAPVDYSLPDGSYRLYGRISDSGSSGRFSDWDYTSFTVALDPMAAPSVAVASDSPNNRFAITINGKQNMLTTFEATAQGGGVSWYSISGANAAAPSTSTDWSVNGSTSLKMTAQSGGPHTMAAATGGFSGNKQRVIVTPGTQYAVRAVAKAGTTARVTTLSVDWYKSDGTASTVQANSVVDTETVTSGGLQLIGTATAPSDAATCEIRWSVANVAASESHYLDQIAMAPGSSGSWYRGGLLSYQKFFVERSFDGITWETVRLFGSSFELIDDVSIPAGTQQITVYDYEAPRQVSVQYRARAYANTPDPYEAYSPYSNTAGGGINISTSGGDRWWFKVPYRPDLNRNYWCKGPTFSTTEHEAGAFFRPIGRKNAVKVSDVIQGEEFPLTVFFDSKAEFDAMRAIRAASNEWGTPILIQAQDGREWWANFGLDVTNNELFLGNHIEYVMNFIEADAVPS